MNRGVLGGAARGHAAQSVSGGSRLQSERAHVVVWSVALALGFNTARHTV